MAQAASALASQLSSSAKTKGFKGSALQKLAIDVPVADQSAPAVGSQACMQSTGIEKFLLCYDFFPPMLAQLSWSSCSICMSFESQCIWVGIAGSTACNRPSKRLAKRCAQSADSYLQ